MIPNPVQFKGVPGSPYTRKMLAYLRYRQIPYELLIGDQADEMGLPAPRVSLLPTFYLPDADNQLQGAVDSTPLIRRFETEIDGRSALPGDPAMAFINDLIEDYGDEWLTKPMFHYRWYYDADIEMAGKILPLWRNPGMPDEVHEKASSIIAERQISRLYVVGSNDTTAPVIEASYHRFLSILDTLLKRQRFVLGNRPSSGDFALYAQLTQLAKFDPTPQAICIQEAPAVYAWTDIVDDLSGLQPPDDAWLTIAEAADVLTPLLQEIGKTYIPALLANAAAIEAGNAEMQTLIDGKQWVQPTFPYQAKCLQALRSRFAQLEDDARTSVRDLLSGTGCEAILT